MSSATYSEAVKDRVKQHVKDHLMLAKQQKGESQKFSGLQNVTQFGVAKASGEGGGHGEIKDHHVEDLEHQNN